MFRSKALLLLAGLAVGCSGGDNNENSSTNNAQPDMSATADMGTNPNSGTPDMTMNPTPDMSTPTPDMNQPPPTCEAFPTVYEYAYSEVDGAYYVADDSIEYPLSELSIELYEAPAAGTFDLGENYETCVHCVLIYADCDENACAKTFLATSGTLELTEAGQEGERFTGSLSNVQFEEVTVDENTFRSTAVAGGELRCIDSHPFDIYLGNICTMAGEECESDRSVEDPAFTCVDDGTGVGLGTCEMVPMLNLPELCMDTSFVGQIGGSTVPDGGAYTDVAYTNDAGLQAVYDAIPASAADAVTDLSANPLAVTSAIVTATNFADRASWHFWVQDTNQALEIRLTDMNDMGVSLGTDVRVGQAVSFSVTSVETFSGHPRVKSIENFVVDSEGNDVYVIDRSDSDITAADYGKIIRAGGTVGAPTACGGTNMCYDMTYGTAMDKTVTFRSSSQFVMENDCVVYVGPVNGFPGPKDPNGIMTLQLNTLNFDWMLAP